MTENPQEQQRWWPRRKFDEYYTYYMPWVEDKYLAWYGENKTSYTTKQAIKDNKLTGDKNLGAVQDGIAEGVGGQVASGGVLGSVGDTISKQGFNRAERGETGAGEVQKQGNTWTNTLSGGLVGENGTDKK